MEMFGKALRKFAKSFNEKVLWLRETVNPNF